MVPAPSARRLFLLLEFREKNRGHQEAIEFWSLAITNTELEMGRKYTTIGLERNRWEDH